MTSVFWCELLLVLLAMWGQCGTGGAECHCKCPKTPVCVDLRILQNLVRNASTGRSTDPDRRILLGQAAFDRIRQNSELHGCVLMYILDFYQKVLLQEQLTHLAHFLKGVKRCIRQNAAVCSELREAINHQVNQTRLEADLGSRELVMLQMIRLDEASQQLTDRAVQDKALVELEALEDYITGSSFRGSSSRPRKTTKIHG